MLDAQTTELLGGGCALIVAVVDADGVPYATRAWGVELVDTAPCRLRLLFDADDELTLELLSVGGRLAVTAADVATLRSVQLKGVSQGLDAVTDDDRARHRRYVDAFYDDIERTDGTSRALLDRFTPNDLATVVVEVTDCFDQTPGPAAGRELG